MRVESRRARGLVDRFETLGSLLKRPRAPDDPCGRHLRPETRDRPVRSQRLLGRRNFAQAGFRVLKPSGRGSRTQIRASGTGSKPDLGRSICHASLRELSFEA